MINAQVDIRFRLQSFNLSVTVMAFVILRHYDWSEKTACRCPLQNVIKISEIGLRELKWQLLKPECTGASHRWFRHYYFFPFVRVFVAVKVCHVQKCRVVVDWSSTTAAQHFWGKCISVCDNPFTPVALPYSSTAMTTLAVLFPCPICIVTVQYYHLPCSWSLCSSTSFRQRLVFMLWSAVICPVSSLMRRKVTLLEIPEYFLKSKSGLGQI
jgi:hypothetical protein